MPRHAPIAFAGLTFVTLLAAAPASAFTPEEVAAAAAVAHEVEADVRQLAADELGGRASGTPGGTQAQELLIDQLQAIGPPLGDALPGREAYRQRFDSFRANLLARIPGGARADEYVIVGAHYDHPPSYGCNNLGDDICNGAADNATGVAAVLAIGRALLALPAPPARSVVLALWDGEEDGLLGSNHFVNNPLVPLAHVATYVNFDMQGSNLAPSLREMSFAIGTETGGALLAGMTRDAIDAVGLDTRLLSVVFGQARSDYFGFHLSSVPIVFFSDATNACYHTTGDEVDVVDFGKLARQSEIGFRLVLTLAESAERPALTPPAALTTFDDLTTLSDLLTRSLADLGSVFPAYRDDLQSLEEQARSNVEEGPEAMDELETVDIALGAIDVTTNGFPCDPLLLPEPGGGALGALAALLLASGVRRPLRQAHR